MEDYIDYVSRQFNILLQHLTTVWGLQIKAELANITNHNTLSEQQKVRIYVLCKILCVETIFSVFKEMCACFVDLFSVATNSQRCVYKSIFKIECSIVPKRADPMLNAAPGSMVIFTPEESIFISKICELIEKVKTVYERGIAYFIKAGFSLGYENSEVYVGNEFVSHCVETTTNVTKAHVASKLRYSYDAARRQIDSYAIYHRNTPITESMQTKAATTWLISVSNIRAVETLGSKLSAIDMHIQQFLSHVKCQLFCIIVAEVRYVEIHRKLCKCIPEYKTLDMPMHFPASLRTNENNTSQL